MVRIAVAVSLLVAVAVLLLVPFHPEAGLLNLLHSITSTTRTARDLDWFLVESGGNFGLFALVGAAALFVTRRPSAAVLVGCLLSAAAETVQVVIPERVASWTDLVTNCLGTLAGVGGAVVLRRLVTRRGSASENSATK